MRDVSGECVALVGPHVGPLGNGLPHHGVTLLLCARILVLSCLGMRASASCLASGRLHSCLRSLNARCLLDRLGVLLVGLFAHFVNLHFFLKWEHACWLSWLTVV